MFTKAAKSVQKYVGLIVVGAAIFLPSLGNAQGSITDKVIDKNSLTPIVGAEVTYALQEDSSTKYVNWTDANGEALFADMLTPIIELPLPKTIHKVTIEIFNISGQRLLSIKKTIDLNDYTISQIWDGKNSFGGEVANGIYFSRIKADDFSVVEKLMHFKGTEVKSISKPKFVRKSLGKVNAGKDYDVSISHEDYAGFTTARTISDGDNGVVVDSLEATARIGYGKIKDRIFLQDKNLFVSDARVSYVMQEDTTKKWTGLTIWGSFVFDSLLVNLPESKYIVKIEPTDNSVQFTERKFFRTIVEGDNGIVTDTVYALTKNTDLSGVIRDVENEQEQSGVIVRLRTDDGNPYTSTGDIIKSTTTDANGKYNFVDVPPGAYEWEIGGKEGFFAYKGRILNLDPPQTPKDTTLTGFDRALIPKQLLVPGTNGSEYITGTAREIKETIGEDNIEDNMGRGIRLYLDGFSDTDSLYFMELMHEADSLFYGKTGPWVFGRENKFNTHTQTMVDYWLAGNYEECGWNVKIASNHTNPIRAAPDHIIGGSIEIAGNRDGFFKELYGRLTGRGDVTSRGSYMNLEGRDPPTVEDRAYFRLLELQETAEWKNNIDSNQMRDVEENL